MTIGLRFSDRSRPLKGLRFHFFIIAIICLIPILAVSSLSTWWAATALKESAKLRLSDKNAAIANSLELTLRSRFDLIETAVTTLQNATKIPDISHLAIGLKAINLKGNFYLIDSNTSSSNNLFRLANDTGKAAIKTNSRVASNILAQDGSFFLALAAPADAGGGGERALVLVGTADELIDTLRSNFHRDTVVKLIDGNGVIIASSQNPDHYLGKTIHNWDQFSHLNEDSGQFETTTIDSHEVIISFKFLSGTPRWRVITEEPLKAFRARWYSPFRWMLLSAGLTIAVAVAAVMVNARIISSPLIALLHNMRDISKRKPSSAPFGRAFTTIHEFAELRCAMRIAEVSMKNSERRYKAVAEAGALVFWRWSPEEKLIAAHGWKQLTGISDSLAIGDGWLDCVHADDKERLIFQLGQTVSTSGVIDVEFRLSTYNGRWMWVRDRGAPVFDDDGGIVEWVGVLEDIDVRKSAEHQITYLAYHDGLTGLANRGSFRAKTEELLAKSTKTPAIALIYLDLDRFKQVNDTFGHAIGDALLQMVADRLRLSAGKSVLAARLGGDEFVLVQQEINQPIAALNLGHEIVEQLSNPYQINGEIIQIGASAGIAIIASGEGLDGALKRADDALYKAKSSGRGQVFVSGSDQTEIWKISV